MEWIMLIIHLFVWIVGHTNKKTRKNESTFVDIIYMAKKRFLGLIVIISVRLVVFLFLIGNFGFSLDFPESDPDQTYIHERQISLSISERTNGLFPPYSRIPAARTTHAISICWSCTAIVIPLLLGRFSKMFAVFGEVFAFFTKPKL